ncbi:hypothetical protein OG381_34550 [Streptomyces sp. NBC_00490]|uniref:hypothetical protein n=1 Tax=Streptomyces sp. NBC_00490 TaxID=2903657 RepID=UPI002E188AF7
MTASRQTKKAWGRKLEEASDAVQKAKDDLLVTIYQARTEGGLSQGDVSYHVAECSPSGVKAKEERGRAIVEARRGSKRVASTP